MLGVDDPPEREELHSQLYAFAVGYRNVAMGKINRPRSGEIVDALRVIPEYCNKLHGAIATLLVARMTAPEGCGPNEQLRREIYPLVADTVLRFTDQQAFEWKGGFEDPLFGLFGRLARDFAPLSDLFTSDDFRETTRPDHPALVKLIGQLGDLWLRETGRVKQSTPLPTVSAPRRVCWRTVLQHTISIKREWPAPALRKRGALAMVPARPRSGRSLWRHRTRLRRPWRPLPIGQAS